MHGNKSSDSSCRSPLAAALEDETGRNRPDAADALSADFTSDFTSKASSGSEDERGLDPHDLRLLSE